MYDTGANRVKKYIGTAGGDWETITYIDGIIEYRENDANDYQSINHVMDDTKRIATIREGDTFGDTTPAIKYNLDDQIGSSNILVDENGTLVNIEEYYPFGEMRSIRERHKKTIKHVSQTSFGSYAKKRYRFCGKEKDEETRRVRERLKQKIIGEQSGMYYYGARYYSPWLCRFISVDPLAGDYPFYSSYVYAGNKVINKIDIDGMQEKGAEPAPTEGNGTTETNENRGCTWCGKNENAISIVDVRYKDPRDSKVTVEGTPEQKEAFLKVLNERTGNVYSINENGFLYNKTGDVNVATDNIKSGELSQLVESVINGKQMIPIKLVNGSESVFIDQFSTGEVDINDIQQLSYPELQAGLLGHIFAERNATPDYKKNIANKTIDSYYDVSHDVGMDTEMSIISCMINLPVDLTVKLNKGNTFESSFQPLKSPRGQIMTTYAVENMWTYNNSATYQLVRTVQGYATSNVRNGNNIISTKKIK